MAAMIAISTFLIWLTKDTCVYYNVRDMNAQEFLNLLTERRVKSLFEVARTIPADRLAWEPAPGARSALNILQEVSTAVDAFWQIYTDRRMDWSPESYSEWLNRRESLTDIDDLETACLASTARLAEFTLTVPTEELLDNVELPFPGDHDVAEILSYHYWNVSYHEGQLNYIVSLIGEPAAESH